MIFNVSDNKKFLVLTTCTANEYEQLEFSFTKKIDGWYIIRRKIPHWDGEVKFIDKWGRIPVGLWMEVQKLAKKFHFPLEINGIEYLYDKDYDSEKFNVWVYEYFEKSNIIPRDYQIEATSRLLKFKNCTQEISTSGGKTLIAFIFFKYLFNDKKIKKMLYVVPNINLVTQSEDKFYEYEDECGNKPNWKSASVFGGRKDDDKNINIVFGTYQTLAKKDLEYFKDFDAVCIDECHHSSTLSIKKILIKCQNAEYKFGLTGTLPIENSCNSFTIQSYLGPKVYTIYSADLIAAGNATPVNVISIELNYLDLETKKKLYNLRNVSADEKDGVKLLNLEKDIVRTSRKRLLYICGMITKSTKNSLVLFSDIKNEYGRTIFNWLKENTDKNVYYIDGGTKNENREYYKQQIEEQKNTIITASIGTFGEGIDILNIHNIFIVESYKSMYIVRQVLGRGMRLMEGKDKIMVIDFCDSYTYGTHKYQRINYLMRHANERARIYRDRGFPYKRFAIKL